VNTQRSEQSLLFHRAQLQVLPIIFYSLHYQETVDSYPLKIRFGNLKTIPRPLYVIQHSLKGFWSLGFRNVSEVSQQIFFILACLTLIRPRPLKTVRFLCGAHVAPCKHKYHQKMLTAPPVVGGDLFNLHVLLM
jgi:hypothetical protein